MTPFIILDIETTGLEVGRCQLLEIGAIYVDNLSNKAFDTFRVLVKWDVLTHVEPSAIPMVEKWNAAMRTEKNVMGGTPAVTAFSSWGAKRFNNEKVRLAGKNLASFDIPVLQNYGLHINHSHRILDVGSMYFKEFGYVPSLGEINKLTGRAEVAHSALEDCFDVLAAIKYKS